MSNESKKQGLFFNLKNAFSNNKKIQYFLIALILIVIVVICFSVYSEKNTSESVDDVLNDYVISLENRLSSTLSKVSGAGKVSLVITVESGKESVLAMKTVSNITQAGTETEETPIIVNGKTVVIKELNPKIVGVLIVAEGANNISVMNRIQQATMSLLDIEINQIEILTMK